VSLKKLPSINAVAEHAGVSIATVSRVLNNSKPVGEATRQRVEAAVLELGFRANAFGRNLARARSNLLLVLVPDVANPFYGQIVQGVETVARHRGYKIVLADTSGDDEPHRTGLDAVYDRLADGVISLAHLDETEPVLQELRRVPWVACSEFVPDASMPYVSIDHRQAAIDAVQYLLNRGHRRIALITDFAMGAQEAGALLSLQSPPTAVFAVSDTLAIGAIKAFSRAGRRVPHDIAVMGFDNIPLSEVFEPGLTTIGQPMRELGAAATEMLLERLGGGEPAARTLPHALLVRESA
jgi:DNA-binding LacI/PurR family transcriptional regulator